MTTDAVAPITPAATESTTELATQMTEVLEGLPLDSFLRTWNQLTWWISAWPLFKHLAAIELSFPETFVLQMLMMKPLNVSEVAQLLGLSHSSASRTVDRLAASAYVSRDEDPEDRRQKRLSLTETGAAKVQEIEEIFGAEFIAIATGMSRDEQQALQRLLSRVVAASVTTPDAPPERVTWGRAFVASSGDNDRVPDATETGDAR